MPIGHPFFENSQNRSQRRGRSSLKNFSPHQVTKNISEFMLFGCRLDRLFPANRDICRDFIDLQDLQELSWAFLEI
jgi:hypothetical protein